MYRLQSPFSARRLLIAPFLLLCAFQFCVFNTPVNGDETLVAITGDLTINGGNFSDSGGLFYMFTKLKTPNRVTVIIRHFIRGNAFSMGFILSEDYTSTSQFPPITINVTDFHIGFCPLVFRGGTTTGSTINVSKATSVRTFSNGLIPFLDLRLIQNAGTAVYISDITGNWPSSQRANTAFVELQMYRVRVKGADALPQDQTGVFISGLTVTGAQSVLARTAELEFRFYSGTEHWDVVTVDNTVCESCLRSFFMDRSDNTIENGLLRFQNCQLKNDKPFYVITDAYNTSSVLNLSTNGNLIISNVTTNGPLFGYNASNDGVISSASRLTLHNITAKSLYPNSTTERLFATDPVGQTQIYVGPFTLDGKRYTTKEDYDSLNLSYTRVIDEDRKVVYIADSSKARSLTTDASKVGEFSASHCVNNGYTGVTSQTTDLSIKPFAQCVCAESRYLPHCVTVYDPFREGTTPLPSCPPGTTMSRTLKTCVACNVPNCAQCDIPNVCAVCDEGTVCTIGGDQDTKGGIPWWVWLIVGLAAAVVVGLLIFLIVWCFFCEEREYFIVYEEDYDDGARHRGREVRLWEPNGNVSTSSHGPVIVVDDSRQPRIYKQDDNNVHGDTSSVVSSDYTESSSDTDSSLDNR